MCYTKRWDILKDRTDGRLQCSLGPDQDETEEAMKKKLWAALLALCMISMPAAAVTAQAKAPAAEQRTEAQDTWDGEEAESAEWYAAPRYGTKAAVLPKAAFAAQVTAAVSFWQNTVEALAPFTYGHNVKVNNYSDADAAGLIYESEGSGVILTMDENFIYIATAAHCLKRTNTEVTFADGSLHKAAVAYLNEKKDVGFLLVNRAELQPETLAVISPAVGADAAAAGKVSGDVLFVLNSADEPNGGVYAGILDQYSVVYPNNPEQNVLQFFSDVSHGSSGGAVYSAEGIWVGSVSGGDTYGTCWAVPYGDILNEFNAWLAMLALQQAAAA